MWGLIYKQIWIVITTVIKQLLNKMQFKVGGFSFYFPSDLRALPADKVLKFSADAEAWEALTSWFHSCFVFRLFLVVFLIHLVLSLRSPDDPDD